MLEGGLGTLTTPVASRADAACSPVVVHSTQHFSLPHLESTRAASALAVVGVRVPKRALQRAQLANSLAIAYLVWCVDPAGSATPT